MQRGCELKVYADELLWSTWSPQTILQAYRKLREKGSRARALLESVVLEFRNEIKEPKTKCCMRPQKELINQNNLYYQNCGIYATTKIWRWIYREDTNCRHTCLGHGQPGCSRYSLGTQESQKERVIRPVGRSIPHSRSSYTLGTRQRNKKGKVE